MSCEITTKTFEEIKEVRIHFCNKEELDSLIKAMESSIEQKLQKLNILVKNCDVYADGKSILVHDRFAICTGLKEVCEAFGLITKQVSCSLRGKTYIIYDPLLGSLRQLGATHKYGKSVANAPLSQDIQQIIDSNVTVPKLDSEVLQMVENIMTNGEYLTTKKRTVSETYEDSLLLDRSETEWISDEANVKKRLLALSSQAQQTVQKANENLRDGTSKLIYARARQMGYSVQEIQKGTQVQLVLVRSE